jgi:hypothetical protein
MAFLSKGGPNCGTLLLHDGSLICNCLCGPDVTNELFDYDGALSVHGSVYTNVWGQLTGGHRGR